MLALARHTVRTNSSRATAALLAASSSFSSSSSSYGVGGARQLSYEIKKVRPPVSQSVSQSVS